jgi:uncharacterized protein
MRTADAADEFLACKRIAVTGVSRTPANHGANVVYKRLRERGYTVYAVNPNTETVEGDRSYPSLHDVPEDVEAVVIGTRPERAVEAVKECIDLDVRHVWMHRPPGGKGSVSEEATALGRAHGITVIDGGCPCMFGPTSDGGHRFMRVLGSLGGSVPRSV